MANVSILALPDGSEHRLKDGTVFTGTSTQWESEVDKSFYTFVCLTDLGTINKNDNGVLTEIANNGSSSSPIPVDNDENVVFGTSVAADDTDENVIMT